MSQDPEAAWPLMSSPVAPQPPAQTSMTPLAPAPPQPTPYTMPQAAPSYAPLSQVPTPSAPPMAAPVVPVVYRKGSQGPVIAKLAIIMGLSVPLTAIAVNQLGFKGLIFVWIGIIIVAALALLPGRGTK